MQQANLEYEKSVLSNYLSDLKGFTQSEESELSKHHAEYLEELKDVKIAGSLADRMSALSTAVKSLKKKNFAGRVKYLGRLKKILKSPYFSRIDITSDFDATSQSYYLGKLHYVSKTDRSLAITDWRAPVASLYYNYPFPTKNAAYSVYTDASFDVEKINYKCALELRRTIDIENGEIFNIYDNSQTENISKDAFLLTKLEQKTGGQLEDIIETIQTDQYKIIVTNPLQNLVVQGVAGSGKTSVAIHRISYIFYNFANLVKPEKTIFISASKVLINYLAKSLPELDVQEIKRLSLYDLISLVFVENKLKIRKAVTKVTTASEFDVYFGDLKGFVANLDRFISKLDEELKTDLQTTIFSDDTASLVRVKRAYQRISTSPIFSAASLLERELKDIVKDLKKEASFSSDVYTHLLQAEMSLARLIKFKKSIYLERAYSDFLSAYYGVTPSKWDINHYSAMYYMAYKLGLLTNLIDFDLVVVDEAQDLNILQLTCLKTLSSKECFNFYGDLNQSISKRFAIKSWDDLKEVFPGNTLDFNLYVSFRSTRQIVERASRELIDAGITENIPLSVARDGEVPIEKTLHSYKETLEQLAQDIYNIRREKRKSIGIVTTSEHSQEDIKRYLAGKGIDTQIITDTFEDFEHDGTYLVDIGLVKGLEFDSVFILNMNSRDFDTNTGGHFKKFVAITRAMSDIFIYFLL